MRRETPNSKTDKKTKVKSKKFATKTRYIKSKPKSILQRTLEKKAKNDKDGNIRIDNSIKSNRGKRLLHKKKKYKKIYNTGGSENE